MLTVKHVAALWVAPTICCGSASLSFLGHQSDQFDICFFSPSFSCLDLFKPHSVSRTESIPPLLWGSLTRTSWVTPAPFGTIISLYTTCCTECRKCFGNNSGSSMHVKLPEEHWFSAPSVAGLFIFIFFFFFFQSYSPARPPLAEIDSWRKHAGWYFFSQLGKLPRPTLLRVCF